ncbi:LLM class F420-dependent oxidoreductase [Amycolatopsis sp. DG1A-15b]|uniref:LLM class F420-dependent oxidoreductase n=1 Tax=Amycolatopsis sp. DG1A-15b TaxID=3052846 RepID=UPI00255BA23E|nr:LLM class F420-dependent oxidoreductase [Amycolatopsis sp. DG1A-15b]WIX84617.1 LLM class F420-dependent oxidoreductase [Amycolatopsis sp. DG1A-15b]
MKLSVSLGLWQDRPPEEALETAGAAEAAGYSELWIGEMATWDAFALGTAIGAATSRISLTFGPLAVTVRDPATIAMGVASVAALTGRTTGVALGTSSDVVVRGWHGRSRARSATALAESAVAVRQLVSGEKSTADGSVVGSHGYRLRLPAPKSPLTIAAFGPKALEVAARHADRMVVNLVSPAAAESLVRGLHEAASRAGTPPPPVAAWVVAAVDPDPAALEQLRRGVVGYLAAPGYGEMFRAAGFGDLVDFARTRPHPRELLAAVPVEAIATVGLLGSPEDITAKAAEYAEAGIDELAIVPATSDDDPGGAETLAACRSAVVPFDA